MKKLIPVMAVICICVFSIIGLSSLSSPNAAEGFSDAQKAELQIMFKEYILNNGETVIESVEGYQANQEEESRKAASQKAKSFIGDIAGKNLPMTGNKNGDITLVEFFDYNCGYCRRALDELEKVLEKDDKLKVVFFDMPILGPSSLEVSKWSLAAQKQGKYFEYHKALLNHNGQKTETALEKLAKDAGLDIEQLKKDKDSDEIATTLKNNVEQAQSIGIRGTPGFIINGEVFPGYMPASRIMEIIKDARKG